MVHAIDPIENYHGTHCGWARVWDVGEWTIVSGDRMVTCLECLVTPARVPYKYA